LRGTWRKLTRAACSLAVRRQRLVAMESLSGRGLVRAVLSEVVFTAHVRFSVLKLGGPKARQILWLRVLRC
jgi:hypothetical protein